MILGTERELNRLIYKYRQWLQQRPMEHLLNEMKVAFAQISYETTAEAFVWTETNASLFLPPEDHLFSILRGKFIQALGEMKELSYEELKRVFTPVMTEQGRRINIRLHQLESLYLESYRNNNLNPLCRNLCGKLRELLQPFPEIYQAVAPDLDGLADYFVLNEPDTEIQNFCWIHSPIPDRKILGTEWNVMGYVEPVIREAIKSYRDKRLNQILQFLEQSKHRLDDEIQKVVRDVFAITANCIKQWNSGERTGKISFLLDRLRQLETDSRELKEQFLADTR